MKYRTYAFRIARPTGSILAALAITTGVGWAQWGPWTEHLVSAFPDADEPFVVSTADIDGDGDLDVVSGS